MIRLSKTLLYITLILLFIWQLPWCYNFLISDGIHLPFTLYSSVNGEFISVNYNEDKGVTRADQKGQTYTREQTDSLLPFFYMRQLVSDNRFPDSIKGIPVTPHQVQLSNFNFKANSSDINCNTIGLYPLMESMSGRVELVTPDDVFRIDKEGITFIDMATNTVNESKSQLFTKAMEAKGFKFPSKIISGNPTTKKDYDEGYLIIDSEGELFHFKQIVGRPYVRHIELPNDIEVKMLFITEFRDKKTLAFIADTNNKFYVLENKSYKLYYTGIDNYDPYDDSITVLGNMLDWTIFIDTDKARDYYALDANTYTIIKKMSFEFGDAHTFGLNFTSYKDKYVKPRFSF